MIVLKRHIQSAKRKRRILKRANISSSLMRYKLEMSKNLDSLK